MTKETSKKYTNYKHIFYEDQCYPVITLKLQVTRLPQINYPNFGYQCNYYTIIVIIIIIPNLKHHELKL